MDLLKQVASLTASLTGAVKDVCKNLCHLDNTFFNNTAMDAIRFWYFVMVDHFEDLDHI